MDEEYPLASAKYVVACADMAWPGEHLTIFDDPRIGVNYVAACREIIRLNQVVEGMKNKTPIMVDKSIFPKNMDGEPICYKCFAILHQVRPGKWQCPECE